MSGQRVAAVVLAAGLSSRMAPRNKLLLAADGKLPMVARVVRACAASRAELVVVVTGHQAILVEQAVLSAGPVRTPLFAYCSNYASGLSASLRRGIAAVSDTAEAALICLGDMPLVTSEMIDRIIDAYDPSAGRAIVAPACQGRLGNPVLWDRRFFAEMATLSGDTGARALLRHHAGVVSQVEIGHAAILTDYDTPEALVV